MFDELTGFIGNNLRLLFTTAFDTSRPEGSALEKRVGAIRTVASNLVSLAIYAALILVGAHAALVVGAGWLGVSSERLVALMGDSLFSFRRPVPSVGAFLALVAAFVGGLRLFQLIAVVTRRLHVFAFVGLAATVRLLWTTVPELLESRSVDQLADRVWILISKGF